MRPKPLVYSSAAATEYSSAEAAVTRVRELVFAARYREAFRVAQAAYVSDPSNRFSIYNYAVQLGDCEEWASKELQRRNSKKAAGLLRTLLRRTRGIDPRWVAVWKNEYYWFSKQPHKQWRLGRASVKLKNPNGYYSMGVGAVSLSFKYFRLGNKLAGRAWADRAVSSWGKYFLHRRDYYNSYVWFAKSLGLSGNFEEMEDALRTASKLSGRALTYSEFKDARSEVYAAVNLNSHRLKRPLR